MKEEKKEDSPRMKWLKDPAKCPRLDARRFWKEQFAKLGQIWPGPEPEEFSPKNLEEEEGRLSGLLSGEFLPRTSLEERLIRFVGPIEPMNKREQRWINCRRCKSDFKVTYVQGANGKKNWPTICEHCADSIDSEYFRTVPIIKKSATKKVNSPFQ